MFENLSADKCRELRRGLARRLGVTAEIDGLFLLNKIAGLLAVVEEADACKDSFDLNQVLKSKGVFPKDLVYINWHRFDDIDRMRIVDLKLRFTDIWYPSADDIEVFDDAFSWILSITHDGSVRLGFLN